LQLWGLCPAERLRWRCSPEEDFRGPFGLRLYRELAYAGVGMHGEIGRVGARRLVACIDACGISIPAKG